MKISYNWLKDFLKTDKTPEELSTILTDIGLEVESLEYTESIPGGLAGLVIAEVLSCEPHPDADRLRVTTVNKGDDEILQVVCGAPNVAQGQRVVLAGVGTTVYPIEGEPFKIKKSKIRGQVSEGMICAEDEIGLGQSHAGIMVLPTDAPIGKAASEYFDLDNDAVFEIGLTPNRADAASHLGVARDIAAFLKTSIEMPQVAEVAEGAGPIEVRVDDATLCPRYSSLTIEGIQVAESPKWLRERLLSIGVRPINNVVDITNYVLHELGQPLHAFDAAKIAGKQVIVKTMTEGTAFITLDDVERKLSGKDLMICDTENALCIAGVFGGQRSGVTEGTTSVFLESAYFNAVSVRKTSKFHALKTDASFRFERGTDPDMTVFALKRAARLIVELAGGTIQGGFSDLYPSPLAPFKVSVSTGNVRKLIGADISDEEIRSIIEALDIRVVSAEGPNLELEVMPYRVDVTREVDIIEEVLRIYGYNQIEIKQQLKASLNPSPKPDRELVQNQIADLLIGNGFNEILNNSLTRMAYADKEAEVVRILNPLSSDLDTMRQNLLFQGLEAISYNQKRKTSDLRLFEFGSVYFTAEAGYREEKHLALFMSGNASAEQWNNKTEKVSFYQLKGLVDGLLSRLNIKGLQVSDAETDHLAYGLTYHRGAQVFVSFGVVNRKDLKTTDVQGEVFYADFNWDALMKAIRKNRIVYKEVSRFPSVRRDLAILVDRPVGFIALKALAEKTERKILKSVNVFDVYEGEKIPQGKKSYALSFVFQDEEKTLTDKQIDSVIQKLIVNFEKELKAEIRK